MTSSDPIEAEKEAAEAALSLSTRVYQSSSTSQLDALVYLLFCHSIRHLCSRI